MAYMNQEKKAKIKAALDKVMPKGWKYTLGVENHSSIVFTLRKAPVDLLAEMNRVTSARNDQWSNRRYEGYADVNQYYLDTQFDNSLEVMRAIVAALNTDNYDRSDSMSDYFDVGHYVNLHIGTWNKPFEFTGTKLWPVAEEGITAVDPAEYGDKINDLVQRSRRMRVREPIMSNDEHQATKGLRRVEL